MAIAEHHPDASPEAKKLSKSMSHSQLHDFAATKEKNLPIKVHAHSRHKPKKKPPEPKRYALKYGN
jgi:hypothetical protein